MGLSLDKNTIINYGLIFIGFILTIITWYYSPEVPIGWALPCLVVIIFISIFIINYYRTRENIIDPEVISARKSYKEDSEVMCIIKPSKLFFQDMLVSFYYVDRSGFEDLIGIGRVATIQKEDIIQVEMMYSVDRHKNIIDLLKNNDKDVLPNLRIKHNVPLQDLYSFIVPE